MNGAEFTPVRAPGYTLISFTRAIWIFKKPFCLKTDRLKDSRMHMMSPISLKRHASHKNQGFDYSSQFGSHRSSHPAGKGALMQPYTMCHRLHAWGTPEI